MGNRLESAWLSRALDHNTVRVGKISPEYQKSIPRKEMLTVPPYRGLLAAAWEQFGFRVHQQIALFIPLAPPRAAGVQGLTFCSTQTRRGPQASPPRRCYRRSRKRNPERKDHKKKWNHPKEKSSQQSKYSRMNPRWLSNLVKAGVGV